MVEFRDDNESGKFGESPRNSRNKGISHAHYHKSKDSPLTTLDEVPHERSNMTRSVSTILNTVENIQAATEEFSEHVALLNEKLKHEVLAKIKDLKRADTQLLTERVSPSPSDPVRSKNSSMKRAPSSALRTRSTSAKR